MKTKINSPLDFRCLDKYDIIIWDFDGVIIDSSKIRIRAFKEALQNYPKQSVEELIKYHRKNDGLSRYVKIDHFFSNILEEKLDNKLRDDLLNKYGIICSRQLNDKNLLIDDSLKFIINYYNKKKIPYCLWI
jgi:beta-phosphoglucomutase-like phosphatase (HAD superfamily)